MHTGNPALFNSFGRLGGIRPGASVSMGALGQNSSLLNGGSRGIYAAANAVDMAMVDGMAGRVADVHNLVTTAVEDARVPAGAQAVEDVPEHVAAANTASTWLNHGGMAAAMILPFGVGGLAWAAGKVGWKGAHKNLAGLHGKLETPMGQIPWGQRVIKATNTVLTPFAAAAQNFCDTLGITQRRLSSLHVKASLHGAATNHSFMQVSAFAGAQNLHPELRSALKTVSAHAIEGVNGLPGDFKKFTTDSGNAAALAKRLGRKDIAAVVNAHEKNTARLLKTQGKINHWSDLKNSIRDPRAIHTAPVAHSVGNMMWGAASITSAYVSAHDISKDVETLRELIADSTHQKVEDVTFGQMLFNELPEPANGARNSLLKNAGPRAVLEAVGLLLNMNMMLRGGGFLITMLPQVLGWGVSAVADTGLIDAYKKMKINEKKQIANTPDKYAKLLGAASKELAERGGENSDFAQALALKYAEKKLTATEVIQKVVDGEVSRDVEALQNEHAHKKEESEKQDFSHAANVRKQSTQSPIRTAMQDTAKSFTGKIDIKRQQPATVQVS